MKRLWIGVFVLASQLFGLDITDQKGNSIVFEKPYERIISLYPAHADVISELGAEASLIGVSVDPSETQKFEKIVKFSYHDNAEKFIEAKPDLILIRPMIANKFKGLIQLLRSAGIEVISLQPSTYEELSEYWQKLGRLVGKEEAAREYSELFESEVAKIKVTVASITEEERKSIFFETRHKNFLTTSPGSLPYTIIDILGAKNIAKDAKPIRKGSTVAPYKLEEILAHAKEIDVYIAQKGAMNHVTKEEIISTPGFKALKAVNEEQVYLISEDIISRPTKKLILGMQTLGQIIYPNYFK